MKKVILLVLTLSLLVLAVAGCELIDKIKNSDENDDTPHIHTGGNATCKELAICTVCGESYGQKRMEHNYNEATCTKPKVCMDCGVTFGLPLGHDYSGATCEAPKTCTVCGNVQGEPLNHRFASSTCQTPKTCQDCGITEGTLGEHNYNSYYSYDEEKHWIECAICGDKNALGAHEGGEATAIQRAKCDICGVRYGEMLEISIDWKTVAIAPNDGSVFCLANSRVKKWYDSFDFRTTDTDEHWLGEDIFLPEVPIFIWTVGDDADYYKVYIANNNAFIGAECYLTNTCSLAVEHLNVGADYYWYVDAVYDGYTVRSDVFTFSTEFTPRTIDIDGVSNSRDLGGYITEDGKRIKQGMIYRSAKLDDITELGKYTLLNILGVKTDLDLRGARTEGVDGPYMDMRNATAPIEELNHITVACPWYSTGKNGIWYDQDEFNNVEFAKAIKVFADLDNYPIIFHCSLGRDRTGTLAMVLGGLLGLDENTLMMEYELSVFSYWGTNGSTKYNDGLRNNIHDTYLYIYSNYAGDTFAEKVESFLLEIGVTAEEITSIKDIMLEEVD